MRGPFDIAIVGSGFAGSLMAMIARRLGCSVVMIERGRHPRFVIGESSTPLADLLWGELARRYDLPRLLPLNKWGSWQRAYPQIGCGLKRGFTFFHHTFGQPFLDDARRRHQLLVAASASDEFADTHWYRPEFDHFLVQEAQRMGVEYLDETRLDRAEVGPAVSRLSGVRGGGEMALEARLVIDASGPRGFLHRALGLPERRFDHLPPTQALYSHFTGVGRFADLACFPRSEAPPYPPDDAAVHHVFPGGWIWVLRFNNGITSAGVAATDTLAAELDLAEGAPAWRRLLERLPAVQEHFATAQSILPFVHAPRLPFRSGAIAGPGWVLLPYAAGFIDPLLSTGFPLTLLGIGRLAGTLEEGVPALRAPGRLEAYARHTESELLAAEQLVGALYNNMCDFPSFSVLALLYFAAASFAENARRLGRPELAGGFLLHDHPRFGPALKRCCALALEAAPGSGASPGQRDALRAAVLEAIEPVDVIGLSRADRRNWFPVDPQESAKAALKLGMAPAAEPARSWTQPDAPA
jgi:FADH2 O2-dependent halogenase